MTTATTSSRLTDQTAAGSHGAPAVSRNGSRAEKRVARVLIADDQPLMRLALRELIDREPGLELAGEVEAPAGALQVAQDTRPDLAVVDLMPDGGSGLELIKQFTSLHEHTRVLVISGHEDALFAERALSAGAMGYVRRNEPVERVAEAMRQVLRGRIFLSDRLADRVLHRAVRGGEAEPASPLQMLSDRELEVFQLIGQGLTTRQIAERLHVSSKTVDTHREHIKSKLNAESLNELISRAARWILHGGDPGGPGHPDGPAER